MANSNQIKSTYYYAIAYTAKGFSVISLIPKSKQPSIKWKQFEITPATIEQLENWFVNTENNIGIITGRISSAFDIDIDGQGTYNFFIKKIDSLSSVDKQLVQSVKDTMKIETGSGNTNLLFRFDPKEFPIGDELSNNILWKDSSSNQQNNHSEIRLKGEGGYIVVPPSIHDNGKEYTLVNGINPILLTQGQIEKIIDLFSKNNDIANDISQIIEILRPHYNNGIRNDLVLYLSGWLRKLDVPLEAAEELINELAKDDEEKGNRIRTLHDTYKKQELDEIAGYTGLLKLLTYDCTEDESKEKLTKINDILNQKFGTSKDNKNEDEEGEEEEQIDITLLIKEYYVDLFVDQFNKSCIAIKINGHVEVLGLDGQRFKNWLFRFFYENFGKISSEKIENTIKVLKAEAEFSENRKRLELRVAKAETDDFTFYYDLTNSNWSAVKITPQGWTIENKPPILFMRYTNQLPQVNPILPSSPSDFLTIDDTAIWMILCNSITILFCIAYTFCYNSPHQLWNSFYKVKNSNTTSYKYSILLPLIIEHMNDFMNLVISIRKIFFKVC